MYALPFDLIALVNVLLPFLLTRQARIDAQEMVNFVAFFSVIFDTEINSIIQFHS